MTDFITRRQWLAFCGSGVAAAIASAAGDPPADITLTISEISADLGHGRSAQTIAYNGQVPGPVLRMVEGREVTVDVVNETRRPEMVHWHGMHIPPEVDGAHEEGTPMVQGRDRRRYTFTPQPAGTRWYHAHAMAGHDLRVGSYSGQFGMAIVERRGEIARYDIDVPILLHEWSPYFAAATDMDVSYQFYSINGKMLGAGEPIRVRQGQRALFRVVNASATMGHRLALPGHAFEVVALDGNPVPDPQKVPVLDVAPGERIDAIVEMSHPGVWVLGELDRAQREAGAGIVVEYGGAKGRAQWLDPPTFHWEYAAFAADKPAAEPDTRIPIVIEPGVNGNLWALNGKSYPDTDPIRVHKGARNRLVFDNRSTMNHPVHLHRHSFELVRLGGKAVSGLMKDVVWVPAHQTVEVDVVADNPGRSLFHCHQQFHMDFGFMALMVYAG